MTRRYVYIALGANLPGPVGPPETTLRLSLKMLNRKDFVLVSTSGFKRSPAFPAGSGPDFVNAVAMFVGGLSPDIVLKRLHACERALGRRRRDRWGPRPVDLDLLAIDRLVRPGAPSLARWMRLPPAAQGRLAPRRLVLPHPRMQDRAFVLGPLAEIAPGWRHPLTGRTVAQMHAALPRDRIDAVSPL